VGGDGGGLLDFLMIPYLLDEKVFKNLETNFNTSFLLTFLHGKCPPNIPMESSGRISVSTLENTSPPINIVLNGQRHARQMSCWNKKQRRQKVMLKHAFVND
jgi:hypothetical protein